MANDSNYVSKFGFSMENFLAMIIPNTYEFYWNTSAREFYNRMHKEYKKFWTEERINKAEAINLTKQEVIILASIAQQESNKQEEWPAIAGVYLNRLKSGWKLQADPTLKYLVEDREKVNRIYDKHKTIQSPYNTYQNKGLPPGPIVVPQIQAIDSVLNAKDHEYMYFSAKADLSGYHHFSKTLREHINHANEYQRALNKRNIY
ncbi:MAG: endolytic transglycosylase MltG [Bacteroidetes bacterium SW_10_40_5]|nr:MAG: endolytic transglycosylase MltG [Bacteroidetes bacterium SW_10_40_5]